MKENRMSLRRVSTVVACLSLVAAMAAPSNAQQPAQKKLNKDEQTHFEAVHGLVTAVSSGKQPAPADAKLTFHNHFLKAGDSVYVPYTVEIEPGKLTSFPLALYIRAVSKTPPATPPAPGAKLYAFEDVVFLPKVGDSVSRAMELPAGEYDVHVAVLERAPRDKKIPAKGAVATQSLTVPDLNTGLTTSSVLVARALEAAPGELSAQQQMEQPYTLSGFKVTPRLGNTIPKAEEFIFVFFVYNEGVAASGKPDLQVDYLFYRGAEAKPFSKLASSQFNATTLPAEFDIAAGHQVFAGQGIGVTTFAPGDYKLEIKVTDKTNKATVTRDVPFTVSP
jgi:hypothetical protein